VDKPHAERLTFCKQPYEAAQDADALLIATEWQEFRSPDFDRLRTLLARPLIFDGRNLYDPTLMQRLGFEYFAVGRGCKPNRETVRIASGESL
jgi:UDPglucose 6-dehydrogenase